MDSTRDRIVARFTLLLATGLSVFAPLSSAAAQRPEADRRAQRDNVVSYSAPFERVMVEKDTENVITYYISHSIDKCEYENKVSDIPSKVVTITKSTRVPQQDVDSLMASIRQSGFMQLEKDAYGAEPGQRNYPYTITVVDGSKRKQVIYRDRPDAEKRPESFARLEKLLTEFAAKATAIKEAGK